MKTRTPRDWYDLLVHCQVKPTTAAKWSEGFARELVPGALSAGDAELDDFLGQILHESQMLEKVEESLHYTTAARVRAVWPSRFPTEESAVPYLANAAKLGDKVYGGRMGNVRPGDGYLFRGRALIMNTGYDNYLMLGKALGLDLVGCPDLLKQPDIALRAAIRWWEKTLPDALMGNLLAVTKRVNGGTVGLDHRRAITRLAAEALA